MVSRKEETSPLEPLSPYGISKLASKKAIGKVLNIGTGQTMSINKVFKIIKEKIGKGKYKHYPKDDTELNYVCANISRAKKLISYRPHNSFKSKIEEVIHQLR